MEQIEKEKEASRLIKLIRGKFGEYGDVEMPLNQIKIISDMLEPYCYGGGLIKMIEITCYKCEKCSKIYTDKEFAKKCCTPKYCEYCKCELPHKYYYTACDSCREKCKYERAEKIDFKDYIKNNPNGWITTKCGHIISVDELIDRIEDGEAFDYVYGTNVQYIEINYDQIITQLQEEVMFEDDFEIFSNEQLNEICEFASNWNAKNRFKYYEEDRKVAIII